MDASADGVCAEGAIGQVSLAELTVQCTQVSELLAILDAFGLGKGP